MLLEIASFYVICFFSDDLTMISFQGKSSSPSPCMEETVTIMVLVVLLILASAMERVIHSLNCRLSYLRTFLQAQNPTT